MNWYFIAAWVVAYIAGDVCSRLESFWVRALITLPLVFFFFALIDWGRA